MGLEEALNPDRLAERVSQMATARRLASAYAELVRAGKSLDEATLPGWMEPERLRPAGNFRLGIELRSALRRSPLYFDQTLNTVRTSDYSVIEKKHMAEQAALRWYDSDLKRFHAALRTTLGRYTSDAFYRQERELRKLHSRFGKPGVEDELHASFQRLWPSVEEVLPGGTRTQPDESEKAEAETETDDASGATMPTAAPSEILPGGTEDQVEPEASRQDPEPEEMPTDFVERHKMLRAIKNERERLESDATEGSDALRKEVSELLATIAVHPAVVEIARRYVWSPLKGTEYAQSAIEQAVEAVVDLRERLTSRAPDDAWMFAPLVLGALTQLRLHTVPGVPEFAVALGSMLAKTRAEVLITGATLLVVGLSLVFTGPAGAVAVGMLDLALAGTSLGMAILRTHEQEIAATASDFSPETLKLAQHAGGGDVALEAAAALLSAIALTSAARQAWRATDLLKTPPRTVISQGLDINTTSRNLEAAILNPERAGALRSKRLKDTGPLVEADAASFWQDAEAYNPASIRSEGQMTRQSRVAAVEPGRRRLRTGNVSEERMTDYRLTEDEVNSAQRYLSDDMEQAAQAETSSGTFVPEYGMIDPAPISREAPSRPPLQELPRGKPGSPVITEEQRMFDRLWTRDDYEWPDDIKQWARRQLPEGATDPLVSTVRVGADNPMEIDHIIAVERFRQFRGFSRLSLESQQIVYTFRRNLMPVSKSVNGSRGSKTFKEWTYYKDTPIDPAVSRRMSGLEDELEKELHALIEKLLAQQEAGRGTQHVISPPPGRRLTGDASRGLRLADETRE